MHGKILLPGHGIAVSHRVNSHMQGPYATKKEKAVAQLTQPYPMSAVQCDAFGSHGSVQDVHVSDLLLLV